MITVEHLDPDDSQLQGVVEKSHQTSLYVSQPWLAAFPPAAIFGAYRDRELVAALFTEEGITPPPFVQYRGLLLTRREQPAETAALLREAERMRHPCVWNAPSLVDLRPFFWRHGEATWVPDVRYTYFLDANSRPLRAFPPIEYWEVKAPPELPPGIELDLQPVVIKILEMDSTLTYQARGGILVCGRDAQGRGYLLFSWGPEADSLTWAVSRQFPSFDLGGANSGKSAAKKRIFGGALRTSYRLSVK